MSKDELTPQTSAGAEGSEFHAVDQKRRTLAKAGLGAGAVIATLASRPVFADACTISGMASGNASPAPGQKPCGGCTPRYWQTHTNWPTGYTPATCKTYNNAGACTEWNNDGTDFPFAVDPSDPRYGKTMMQVLWMTGNEDTHQLGAHAVAALLNAVALKSTSSSFGYSDTDIFELWNQYFSSNPEGLKNIYQQLNERICPLS